MRMALTDRRGPDNSPLKLRIENTPWDRLPAPGVMVCAVGGGGWQYIGPVIEAGPDRQYTILPVASNYVADNLRLWHGATESPASA